MSSCDGDASFERSDTDAQVVSVVARFQRSWLIDKAPVSADDFWSSLPLEERLGLTSAQQSSARLALATAESQLRAGDVGQARGEGAEDTETLQFVPPTRRVDGAQPTRAETSLPRVPQSSVETNERHVSSGTTAFTWDQGERDRSPLPPVEGAPSIPGYLILRELGRGGMGVVYHARQLGLKREVALKTIRATGDISSSQQERFRAEAEAVARLRHPNIVQIYEVGEFQGVPYFSLELVEGQSLDKQVAGTPQVEGDAARLVLDLAQAMQYAHEQAVVHRDLKPANILLTSEGHPKITDFGLVKRLDEQESCITQIGMIVGTPSYMAPEQGRSDPNVGPAADIYALGAVLYVLLTGRPPFLAATPMDTVMQLLNTEPVPPSRLQPTISGDIETICLKALQKDPAKRYASAGLLAEDLRRHLAGEPILARPIGPIERGLRWCRRNPALAAVTAIAGSLAMIVLVGAPIAAVRIALERNAAIVAQQRSERSFQEARAAKDTAVSAQARAEVSAERAREEQVRADKHAEIADKQRNLAINALGTLVNRVQDQLKDTARTYHLKQELLATAFEGLQKVQEASSSDHGHADGADATMAEAHQRLGRIFMELGHADSARDEYLLARGILERLLAQDPENPQLQYDLSRATMQLSDAMLLLGNVDEASQSSQRALELRRHLAEAHPVPDVYRNLAKAYVQLANVQRDSDQTPAALQSLGKALRIQEQLLQLAKDSERAEYQQAKRITLESLGDLQQLFLNDSQQARQRYSEALALARALVERDPKSLHARQTLAVSLEKLGIACSTLGDSEEAQAHYLEALNLFGQLSEEDPEGILVQGELAFVLARLGRHAEAAEKARRLLVASPNYARNLYNVACCLSLCAAGVGDAEDATDPMAAQLRADYAAEALQALRAWTAAEAVPASKLKYVSNDPDLKSIRSLPEFTEIIGGAAKP